MGVLDAAMGVPGRRIQHGLKLQLLPLIWDSSEANQATNVRLGLELLQELPRLNTPQMSEIVITVPRDFSQIIKRANQVETFDTALPKAEGNWLDNSHPRRVRIILDEAKARKLEVGKYRLLFPIMVPARLPSYNVFVLTVCGPPPAGSNATCTGPDDPKAIVSFPSAGFKFGESHPDALKLSVSSTISRRCPMAAWLALPFCLAALLS